MQIQRCQWIPFAWEYMSPTGNGKKAQARPNSWRTWHYHEVAVYIHFVYTLY